MNESASISRIPSSSIPGIADSVRVSAADLVFVSGVVGLQADGSAADDFEHEVQLALRDLERALKAQGATFSDVVRFNVYITGLNAEKLRVFRDVRDRIIDTTNIPASTLIGIDALFTDKVTFEIDCVAAVAAI